MIAQNVGLDKTSTVGIRKLTFRLALKACEPDVLRSYVKQRQACTPVVPVVGEFCLYCDEPITREMENTIRFYLNNGQLIIQPRIYIPGEIFRLLDDFVVNWAEKDDDYIITYAKLEHFMFCNNFGQNILSEPECTIFRFAGRMMALDDYRYYLTFTTSEKPETLLK